MDSALDTISVVGVPTRARIVPDASRPRKNRDPVPQLLALLVVLALVSVAVAMPIFIVIWPFILMQDYFLFTEGIDKYSALPIVVGLIAQLFYLGSFAVTVALWRSPTKPSVPPKSTPSEDGSSGRSSLSRRILGVSIFVGTVASLLLIFMSGAIRSGDALYETFVDKCEEEVTGKRDARPTSGQSSRVQDCVERKLDSM
ncbi:hypothetical protein NXT08_24630 (plasmid) [Rhodococcus pyridinivorans]|uniref:hypothetical protein n=1 Tax=Rhodococcus pyridinivorans TaxID=103816 RepID=UPI00216468A2|nr:hypothetical protein [Rhodococcus pyridinivorans]UVT27768.1 hypothetical protein NXT08_24630 [Rhodococcus pyridinivorans]